MGRKYKAESYRAVNWDFLDKAVEKSGYTAKQISLILGYAGNWLTGAKARGTQIAEADMERVASLLKFDMEDAFAKPEEPKEEPKKEPADNSELIAEIKKLTEVCTNIYEVLKLAIDGPEKIPLSKSDRATEILRKEFVSKNGGSVKEQEFKRMLVQAGIGSSYATEAMNNLNARRMTGNNGIVYIVKDTM